MPVPELPPAGSATWYAWAEGIHRAVTEGDGLHGTGLPGCVLLDSFPGADDDEKLTAALSYAAAQNGRPAIMLPHRVLYFRQTRPTYSGMKIIGPPVVGWQNPEQSGGDYNPTKVWCNCGTGTSSWLVGTARTYDGAIRDIQFLSETGAQFFHQPLANDSVQAWNFHNLSFLGFSHVIGSPAEPAAMTLCTTTGHWTVIGLHTQFTLTGSDNFMWTSGSINMSYMAEGKAPAGTALMHVQTGNSFYANLYLTASGDFRALRLVGDSTHQSGNHFRNVVVEGGNARDPSSGALIRVEGGNWDIGALNINYAMGDPSAYAPPDRGYVHQTEGALHLVGVSIGRAEGVDETVPAVFLSGGECITRQFTRGTGGGSMWAGRPRVQPSGTGVVIDSDPTVTVVGDR